MCQKITRLYLLFDLGVKVIMNEAEITDIQAEITGPVGTPYEGGIYKCKLTIEPDFPNNPPKGIDNVI